MAIAGSGLLIVFIVLAWWFRPKARAIEPFTPSAREQASVALYQQPDSWFIERLQAPQEQIDGQTLDPKLQYMFERMRKPAVWMRRALPVLFALAPTRRWLRYQVDRQWRLFSQPSAPMRQVQDLSIAGPGGDLPLRIYHPQVKQATGSGGLPVLVYCHGGGWIFASIAAMDRVMRLLANETGAIVVGVEYRLAPEHPYPAASDDGEAAFLWAREHATQFGGDPQRVGVGGDSAGGHIAVNIVQRQHLHGRPLPAATLLYYPGLGLPQEDEAWHLFGSGYALDATFIDYILPKVFVGYREQGRQMADAWMAPLLADTLAYFPPTIVATAGFDLLRDCGRSFAKRLQAEGVTVRHCHYPSLAHGFLQFSAVVEDAALASREPARLLAELLQAPLVQQRRALFSQP